ncbi:hypothetical protein GALMADRAFT_56115 [Galerina marginata CBS 339.88]|uniref:Beta-catenin-like protein 1 N-terminal domain-containing protein n=1 Tax=Galerina marginata (strain CBS 339.88) TaxID=685588 RepID=A0A067TUU3_GALM3|nr:hypothetical protein GALMADRAFT_56115 [Galerina marginata CBS 339.88]
MDIDKLFKLPKLPSGGNKRKLPDNPTPDILKKLKVESIPPSKGISTSNSGSNLGNKTPSRQPTIEEVGDEDVDADFAPGGDADYFAEEDNEGRFFGGGLTSEQKEILNIFENAVDDEEQDISITQIRKSLLSFERAVNKNQDHRSKYPDDPSKFIDSEADLDSAIKALLSLSQSPSLAYPELVRSGAVSLLVGLLTHENMDIVIDVVELIYELTDEDAQVEYEDEDYEKSEEALSVLVEGLLENQTLELLVDNLTRLNETEEADRQGVFHVLGIFENIVGFNPNLSSSLVSKTNILNWLVNRVQSKVHDENRGYAAELLSIFLQDKIENKLQFGRNNGVEVLLKVLSQYRRRDPVDAEETEFMENLFDSLCSALSESPIKMLFLEAEGTDLMVLMMKEKMQARSRSMKVLDYAMSGPTGPDVCESFVNSLGLKTLFTAFMGNTSKRQRNLVDVPATEDVGHMLGIISSLLSNLPSDSTSRVRVMAKFVEGGYEKIEKLIEIRDVARKRLTTTDTDLEKERQVRSSEGKEGLSSEVEDGFYIRRLDSGLFTFQTVDYILAWLIVEDDGIQSHASRMLARGNQSLHDIVQTLRQYHEHVDDIEDDLSEEGGATLSRKDILQGLISALDGIQ